MNLAVWGKELVWQCFGAADHVLDFSSFASDTGDVVLMVHSVGESGRHGNVSKNRFREILQYVQQRYTVVDLPAVLEPTEQKQVAITFDDGWENFYKYARPVIHELEVPATVFLVSEYLGSDAFMSTEQAKSLVDDEFITVGNHTKTHPYLSRIGNQTELENQICGGKDRLQDMLGTEITRFAYPRGDYSDEAVELVRKSHEIGVSTHPRVVDDGFFEDGVDPYLVPRVKAHHSDTRLQWEMTDLSSCIRELADNAGVVTR